jgi:Outer membrane protein beta-barrel domain
MTYRWFATLFTSLCIIILLAGTASAQVAEHLTFGAGAGFSGPVGAAGNDLNTGWNLDFRGGYRASRYLSLDLDFNYNRWNLNSAALARFGEPGGYTSIWSLSFLPVIRAANRSHVAPYFFGGPGLYYRNLSLTQPSTVNSIFCDPFFGFCYPATFGVNQVVASSTTYKGGVNVGAGLDFRLGQGRTKIFGEARYSRMFTSHGEDITFVPVTFGLRW